MSRFTGNTQKYDSLGRAITKGKGGLKQWREKYPQLEIFDSKAEYLTWLELRKQEQEGKIQNLQRQVSFYLTKSLTWSNNITKKNDKLRPIEYIADFVFERNGQVVVMDCKGWKFKMDKKTGKQKWSAYTTEEYKLKKKLFLDKYPQYIFEEA